MPLSSTLELFGVHCVTHRLPPLLVHQEGDTINHQALVHIGLYCSLNTLAFTAGDVVDAVTLGITSFPYNLEGVNGTSGGVCERGSQLKGVIAGLYEGTFFKVFIVRKLCPDLFPDQMMPSARLKCLHLVLHLA